MIVLKSVRFGVAIELDNGKRNAMYVNAEQGYYLFFKHGIVYVQKEPFDLVLIPQGNIRSMVAVSSKRYGIDSGKTYYSEPE